MAILEIRDLTKHYAKTEALKGLDLSIHAGEVYGFLGRNGAGKSTTIRIIMGITRADGGVVRLFGQDSCAGATTVRQRIGYVAQEQNFYGWMTPDSIGAFVGGFYPTWDHAKYLRLIGDLDLPLRRKIHGFSGGMNAKLALALALAHRPPLLILDEPTAGLDPVARREFIEMVRDQAQRSGCTTFFSSHLVDEVEAAADRIGIVDDGRTRYEGSLIDLSDAVRLFTRPILKTEEPRLPEVLNEAGAGIEILQDRIRRGHHELVVKSTDPVRFAALPGVDGDWSVTRMSLEDIFIDMVSRPLPTGLDA